jgi:hypothetical protein
MKRAARSIDAIYPASLSSSTNSQGTLGFRFHNFLGRLGRPESSPAKLIDEFNWVTITNGCLPPSVNELRKWWEWSQ